MATDMDRRKYTFGDATLCQFTSNLCNTLTRDLSDLSIFGLTAPKIAALKALGDAFEVFPSDEVYAGELMIAAEAKNVLMFQVMETTKSMALRVGLKWGINSGQYKTLNMFGFDNAIEDVVLTTARNVHTRCTVYKTDLATFGLTQLMLDDYEDLNESFEVARNTVNEKKETRNLKALERINKGNEIYDLVVSYCEIGKRVFAQTNPAKYNDYIIYAGGPTGLPGKVLHFVFNYVDNKFAWDAQAQILNYEIERSTNQTVWENVYTGAANSFYWASQEGTKYFRCRAVNEIGAGAWCDILVVTPTMSTPNFYSLTYDSGLHKITLLLTEVTAFTPIFEIYQSKVDSGQPAGTYTHIGDTPNNGYFIDNPTADKRYYFYIVAKTAGTERSGKSEVRFIDIPS